MNADRVPWAILQHWYVCGRKIRLATESIGHLAAPHRQVYRCLFGEHWHFGRRQTRAPGAWNRPRRLNVAKAWNEQTR